MNLNALANSLAAKLDINPDGLLNVLKNTVFKSNATDDQLAVLLIVANQYSLNPWTREIYAFPDKRNGIVPVVGVDGWAKIINSHPQFDGMDFEQDDEKCTCIIYRKDRTHPVRVTEWFSECDRGAKFEPWVSHPKRMLRHKAMIQCARIAFGFGGIYDQDEADRIIEVNPYEEKESVTEGNEGINETDPHREKRIILIKHCEDAAEKGLDNFYNLWKELPTADKLIIGEEEKNRIKVKAMSQSQQKQYISPSNNPTIEEVNENDDAPF